MIITEIRPELEWFTIKMEERLKKNDWRNSWKDCTFFYLFRQAKYNLKSMHQLQKNISKELYIPNRKTLKEFIIKECVDCANFCMMIADNLKDKEDN